MAEDSTIQANLETASRGLPPTSGQYGCQLMMMMNVIQKYNEQQQLQHVIRLILALSLTEIAGYWTVIALSVSLAPRSRSESVKLVYIYQAFILTRQVTRATHVRNRVCTRVELIFIIIIILLIIFLAFIKSKPC